LRWIVSKKKTTSPPQDQISERERRELRALRLLYIACEPLTFDDIRTPSRQKYIVDEIEFRSLYVRKVMEALGNGEEPPSFEEWSSKRLSQASQVDLDLTTEKEWGDLLTQMMGGDYPSKTPKTKKDKYFHDAPIGDDVRMTARYCRGDEE